MLKFWMLTPEEFAVYVECFHRNRAIEADRTAIFLCNLRVAIWGKKRLKPSDILGRPLLSTQRKRKKQHAQAED